MEGKDWENSDNYNLLIPHVPYYQLATWWIIMEGKDWEDSDNYNLLIPHVPYYQLATWWIIMERKDWENSDNYNPSNTVRPVLPTRYLVDHNGT